MFLVAESNYFWQSEMLKLGGDTESRSFVEGEKNRRR